MLVYVEIKGKERRKVGRGKVMAANTTIYYEWEEKESVSHVEVEKGKEMWCFVRKLNLFFRFFMY